MPEDNDCRDDEAWARITFVIQGIWTSGEEQQRSAFKYRLSDLSYGNDMTLAALSSMLNKVFHVFTPFFLQILSPGDLTKEKPELSSAPPQILYLVVYAIEEHCQCVILADALS
eukprot:6182815-Pleurochrysis_carterae.AAC.2